jgi:translation elongation factor EF-G
MVLIWKTAILAPIYDCNYIHTLDESMKDISNLAKKMRGRRKINKKEGGLISFFKH